MLRIVLIAGAVLVLLIWLSGLRRVVRSRDEVAQYIQNLLDGPFDDREWDEFTSRRIRDPELDRIREACIGNESNPLVLRALLDELRGRAA
jgi:hypothetical protein